MTSWIVEIDLPYLRHHWGEAYEISGSGERWAACRRDNLRKLTAGSAHALRDVIRADYLAAPVPRDTMPEQGGTHGSLRPA